MSLENFGVGGTPITNGIIEKIRESNMLDSLNIICSSPKSIKIEICSRCNLKCSFCYNKCSDRHSIMNYEDFKFVINQIKDSNVQQIGLLLSGEPTLNPDLIKIIKYAKSFVPYVFITTNGLLVKGSLAKNIAKSGLDSLKWSINHYNREDFFKNTGVDAFNQVIRNIKNMYYLHSPVNLYASSVVSDLKSINPTLIHLINTRVKPYVKEHYYFEQNNQGGLMGRNYICDRKPLMPCPRLFNNGYITSDLKVVCCCCGFSSYFEVGDLRKQTFMEIWNNKKMQYLRNKHINKDYTDIICTDKK